MSLIEQDSQPPQPSPLAPAPPPTNIVAAVALDGVIFVFDQSGDIYRIQPKPFVIEHLWTGNWPTVARGGPGQTGAVVGAVPDGVSAPSRYGGNFGTPPPVNMPPPPYIVGSSTKGVQNGPPDAKPPGQAS
jgi:hypothetical protein